MFVIFIIISSIVYFFFFRDTSHEEISNRNGQNDNGNENVTITFMVSDNTNMTPINGAVITISDAHFDSYIDILRDKTVIKNVTDPDGICRCEMDEEFLNSSYYDIHFLVQAEGYLVDYLVHQQISQSMTVNFSLCPLGTIKGSVMDNNSSKPIKDIGVTAYPSEYKPNHTPCPGLLGMNFSRTNLEGEFEIIIPIGRYTLVTNGDGYFVSSLNNIIVKKWKTTNVNLSLYPNNNCSIIEGNFTSPACGDEFYKYKPQIIAYGGKNNIIVCTTPTDNGTYSLYLEEGDYGLYIRALGHITYYDNCTMYKDETIIINYTLWLYA